MKPVCLQLLLCTCAAAQNPAGSESGRKALEAQLNDVLQWEILWQTGPPGFRLPDVPLARFALSAASTYLAYCSEDLGVCAQYRTENAVRSWQRLRSTRCCGSEGALAALNAFVRGSGGTRQQIDPRGYPPTGLGAPSSVPSLEMPVSWTTTLPQLSRAEILNRYKAIDPSQTDSLARWLSAHLSASGYRSVTIPCFRPSDPVVYLYGDHPSRGPVLLSIFWNRETMQWEEASVMQGGGKRSTIDRFKDTVDLLKCGVITFK